MVIDTYKTLLENSESIFSEKRSKFLAFAFPINDKEEAKVIIDEFKKKYYDARHVCYAYALGLKGEDFRANDNGEPSGTAGKPILGQIRSFDLTNVLIVVVRYFGGIQLGTGGLIVAYRTATRQTLESANIVERTVDERVSFTFDYIFMNDVMKIVKDFSPKIIDQGYATNCSMILEIRKSLMPILQERMSKVESLKIINPH